MALKYIVGVGFVDGDKKLSANSTYEAQQKRESELRREREAVQRQANAEHRNTVRSTDAYQSSRRSAYSNRTEQDTADFQQSRRNLTDALDNYKRVGERLKSARQVVESGSFGEGTLQYNEAAATLSGLEREYESALKRYTKANNDYQSRIKRMTSSPSSPFYVEEAGVYANAEEAQRAMEQGFTVRHTGSDRYGADMGSSALVNVLDRLNEDSKQTKAAENRNRMQQAYEQTGREFRGQTNRLDLTGGLEEDLDRAKTAEYNSRNNKTASRYEQEALQNDRSAEYLNKSAVELANERKYTAGSNSGREIAANVAANSTNSGYASLNETERRTILSLAAQGRWDDVEDYFNAIDARVNARVHNRRAETIADASRAAQIGAGISSAVSAPAAFAQQLGAEIRNALSDEYRPIDINEGPTSYLRLAQKGQQESLADLPGWAQTLGNVGYSMVQNAAALPLGAAGAAIWLGTSAAGQSSTEALESGTTLGQALLRGSASGLIEAATEKLGLDNLFKTAKSAGTTGVKAVLRGIAQQAGTEGLEEGISEIANTLFDMAQMGEDSAYNQRINELINAGSTRQEAERQANLEFFAKNPALAAAMGAFSGALFGAGGQIASDVNTRGIGKEYNATGYADALIDHALTMEPESEARRIAQQLRLTRAGGKTVDNRGIGQLATAMGEAEVQTALDKATAREQQRVQELEAQAEADRVRQEKRKPYEQEGAAIYRTVAEESGLSVQDSPAVNAAVADIVEAVMGSGKADEANVQSVLTNAATTIENAYLQELSAAYGVNAEVTDDGFDATRRALVQTPIAISREAEQANPELYERALSVLNVTGDGESVGMAYSRLQDANPDSFNADSEVEQLRQLVDLAQNATELVDLSALSESDRTVIESKANAYTAAVVERAMEYARSPEAAQAAVSASSDAVSTTNANASQNGSQAVRKANRFTSKHYSDKEIMRNVVDSASAAGVHANVALSISNVAGEMHVKTEFQNLGADSGINGFYDRENGTIVINADVLTGDDYETATRAACVIYAHELVHHLESTGYYAQLKKVVLQSAEVKRQLDQMSEELKTTATFTDLVKMQRQESAKSGQNITLEQAEKDYIAQFVAENYIGNPGQLAKVARMNRSLAQKILDWMKDILRNVRGVHAGYSELEQAQAALALALDERYMQPDGNERGVEYSIDPGFVSEIEKWDGKTDATFRLGTTSEALKSIGVQDRGILFRSAKLVEILNKHQGMSRDIVKQIPQILEHPVMVLNSRSGSPENQNHSSRLVVFGEVYDTNGAPVTAVIELRPTQNGGEVQDYNLLVSAYGKTKNLHKLVEESEVLYLDPNKNRTDTWLEGLGLQLPSFAAYRYGSMGSVSYDNGFVNISGVPWSEIPKIEKGDGSGVGTFRQKIAPAPSHEPAYNRNLRNGYSSNEMHTEADSSITPNDTGVNTPTSINFGVSSQAELLNRYLEEYGPMLRGERVQHQDGSGRESGTWQAPARTSDSTYTRRSVQTFANTPSLSPADRQIAMEMVDTVGQYVRIGNTETVQQARERRAQYSSFEQAVGAFLNDSKNARVKESHVLVAMGQQLLMESANQQHNKQTTYEVMAALAELQTQLGRGTQAAAIINKLSPEGQLVAVKRIYDRTAKMARDNASKKQRRKNAMDAAAANDVADGTEEAAKGIRKVADEIKRGASDEEIDRMIDQIKEDLRRRVQFAENVADGDSSADVLRKLENLQKQREAELNKLADKNARTREEIKAARARLNELNNELKKAKAQANGAIKRYQDVFAKLDEVKADKSSGRYRKAVEAFDTAKQAAKDARTFAKYAEDNYFAPPKNLMNQMLNAKSEKEREDIKAKIVLYMAEQMPGTVGEKLDAWRYFAMLASLKTHIRNTLGNAVVWTARKLRNTLATGLEAAVIRDKSKRTRSITTRWGDSELYAAARAVFKENQRDIAGDPKYSIEGDIRQQRRVFKGKFEDVRNWAANWLEKEDVWFLQPAFESSWAGFVKARGYDVNRMTDQQKAEAFEFAKNEAQIATFKQASDFVQAIQKFRRTNATTKFIADAVMPFTKTPINILKTSIDYSPAGFVKMIAKGVNKMRGGDYTASEFISDLSSTLTGTGLALLGAWGASAGWITGGEDDDPDRKNALDRAGGFQEYSLHFGDWYFSIDWAAPAVVPVMIGVELYNAFKGNVDDEDMVSVIGRAVETLGRAADPIFEMSMLEGIVSALQSYGSGSQKVSDIAFSAVESYLGQFIPTLAMQFARTIDSTQRSTYSSKDSVFTKTFEQAGRRMISKIPGLSFLLEPVIDRTGEVTPRISENALVRALAQFVSPGNLVFDQLNGTDEELLRLYDLFGETSVLPKSVSGSITYNKQTYNLTSEEYTRYAATLGMETYTRLDELFASEEYQSMSDEDKNAAAADVIDAAGKEAKATILDARGVFNYVRQSTSLEKVNHILEQNWTDDRKFEEFTKVMSDKRNEQIKTLLADGWSMDDVMQGYAKYAELDKTEGMSASAARAELASFMAQRAQKNFLKYSEVSKFLEVFNVGTYMPSQAGTYEKLYAAGLSDDIAKKVSDKMLALKPLNGSEDVTTAQRLHAIVGSGISANDQWKALEAYYATDEGCLKDITAYQEAGASAASYAKTYDAMAKISKEAEAHKDDDSYEGASYYRYKYIAESGMSAAEAEAAYKSFVVTNEDAMENLKPLEEAGLDYKTIAQYRYKTSQLTADKDANGKTISGSKKDKVLREINALPISAAQKDALYLYADYSAKDLNKAPWH